MYLVAKDGIQLKEKAMNISEIKKLAKDRGLASGRMRKAELIHSLQAQERNSQCYNTDFSAHCGQPDCLWRGDCN
jgi:hypothetical protein